MITHGGMFEGMGGTTMAAELALGVGLDTRWVSDIKPAAVALLAARHPDVPNHGDVKTIAFRDVEPVDVLTASWPCQPHSAAGKRLGEADPRALWPDVVRAVDAVRPRIFLGENVSRICTNGELRRVVRSLAAIGYVGAWRCNTAASVGAPHKRDRCFVVAVDTAADPAADAAADALGAVLRHQPGRGGRPDRAGAGIAGDDGAERALLPAPIGRDAGRGGWSDGTDRSGRPLSEVVHRLLPTPEEKLARSGADYARAARPLSGGDDLCTAVARLLPTPTVADSRNSRNNTQNQGDGSKIGNPGTTLSDVAYAARWGEFATAIARWEHVLGRPAPHPTQPGSRAPHRPQLAPAFVEWMQGLPEGWVTQPGTQLSQRGNPPGERNAMLSLLGDGICIPQAAKAFELLFQDLGEVNL